MTIWAVMSIIVASLTCFGLAGCVLSSPRYRGHSSDHFDGKFHNADNSDRGFGDLLRWMLNRQQGPWREFSPFPPGPPPPQRVGSGELRVTYVNHSTVLLQLDGLNILTDPVWSDRASPVEFAGPKRVRPPGIRFEDLPPIDAVLISHDHYDHLDLPTLRQLSLAHNPRFIAPLGVGALLKRRGIRGPINELDWWSSVSLSNEVDVAAVPARHMSTRGFVDKNYTLWAGFVIRSKSGSIYFSGDTSYGPHFGQIADRFGPIRLALLPIGAYVPRWFMGTVHLDPQGAVQAHQEMRAQTSVAIHFGTFPLADDGQDQAVEELEAALASYDPRPNFWVLDFGEGRDVPAISADSGI